ncbi:dipeptidase PepE [Campylobacter corcagiensis]|uniref:Dipeptidase PepE n=1 Tax=Campylobacter corcagiensis TaxID=1448857 RepID=A0A7M1LFA7_9BACT|nr:dipeptidase PepE [Campylobacter corcagiensis]QKF64726.1 (alpha)-aspartyl dipeptidase (peptidase E) [Campylobacter corcagiensis]QOQ87110.1 dipeptidase PepE [Campylobacter corcagiensis]
MKKALLFSSSSYKDTGYLRHCKNPIKEFLGDDYKDEILFIPYAGVSRSNDEYESKVTDRLKTKTIKSIHRYDDKKAAIRGAKTIAVGGGNTFMLLHELYKFDLVDEIKQAVLNGAKYFGWSAGANIAGATMMTTNDMPIIMPKSFDSLGIFPYQINPHFISGKISGHNGVSREDRLNEFLKVHPNEIVYALPEGAWLEIDNGECKICGLADEIYKFEFEKDVVTLKVGENFKI